MISQRVAALEAEVQCCWQSFLASLAPEPGPERPSLRPAGPGPPGRRQRHGPEPRVPIVHGSSFSANSSHLNTTGYQFAREFSATEGSSLELAASTRDSSGTALGSSGSSWPGRPSVPAAETAVPGNFRRSGQSDQCRVQPGDIEGPVFLYRQLGERSGAEVDSAEVSRVGDERMLASPGD